MIVEELLHGRVRRPRRVGGAVAMVEAVAVHVLEEGLVAQVANRDGSPHANRPEPAEVLVVWKARQTKMARSSGDLAALRAFWISCASSKVM